VGVAILWSFTLTPIAIQIYQFGESRRHWWCFPGVVSCFLCWVRNVRSGRLDGIVLGRADNHDSARNLFLFIPFIDRLCICWQHGKKQRRLWSLAGPVPLIPIMVFHAILFGRTFCSLGSFGLPAGGWTHLFPERLSFFLPRNWSHPTPLFLFFCQLS